MKSLYPYLKLCTEARASMIKYQTFSFYFNTATKLATVLYIANASVTPKKRLTDTLRWCWWRYFRLC